MVRFSESFAKCTSNKQQQQQQQKQRRIIILSIESDDMEKAGSARFVCSKCPVVLVHLLQPFHELTCNKISTSWCQLFTEHECYTKYNALCSGRIIHAATDCAVYGVIHIVIMQVIILHYSAVCISC